MPEEKMGALLWRQGAVPLGEPAVRSIINRWPLAFIPWLCSNLAALFNGGERDVWELGYSSPVWDPPVGSHSVRLRLSQRSPQSEALPTPSSCLPTLFFTSGRPASPSKGSPWLLLLPHLLFFMGIPLLDIFHFSVCPGVCFPRDPHWHILSGGVGRWQPNRRGRGQWWYGCWWQEQDSGVPRMDTAAELTGIWWSVQQRSCTYQEYSLAFGYCSHKFSWGLVHAQAGIGLQIGLSLKPHS